MGSSAIPGSSVAPKTFFLENWNTPLVIGSIRVLAVMIVLFFIIYYLKNRKK